MFRTRHWRTCFTWLAFAAILAAALMPSALHALRAQASDRIESIMMAEICAPSGMSYAGMTAADMLAPDMQSPDDKAPGHMGDCAWCRFHTDAPALPAMAVIVEPGEIASPRPHLFYHSPTPLFAWTAARPRGPPLLA